MLSTMFFVRLFIPLTLLVLVAGFSTQPRRHIQHIQTQKYYMSTKCQIIPLRMAGLDDTDELEKIPSDVQNNFDGKGFANYLAPYALAFVASIAITAAFVKFVLMDY